MMRSFAVAVLACALLVLAPRAAAQPIYYFAHMDGPSESPPNASPGTGFTTVEIDLATDFLRITATFQDLLGPTSAAHIHAPTPAPFSGTAGAATQVPSFTGFPNGVTSGMMDQTFDMSAASTWNPAYVTANGGTTASAAAAFAQHLADGRAYFNVHSSVFPGGEIRGFYIVPEPGSVAVLGIAGLLALSRRRIRRSA